MTSLLMCDYAGHAFTYEVTAALHAGGMNVTYSYCSSALSPKAAMSGGPPVRAVSAGRRFEKYSPARRLWRELRYGVAVVRRTWSVRSEVTIVCNMPLISAAVVWMGCRVRGTRFVVWLQDCQSGLAAIVLGNGRRVRLLRALEGFVLRRASRVMAISEDLASEARALGVRDERIRVLENWAPIEALPEMPRENSWATSQGLSDRPVLLYAGTLARKHDPVLLVELARAVADRGAVVVVVSEGEGADELAALSSRDESLTNLRVLPYQPFDRLPDVLGTADILLLLLERAAGPYSVPSKTLSYLCAARPIVASIAGSNPAAQLIRDRSDSGLVVDPADRGGFIAAAMQLLDDPALRTRMGRSGREFAERNFALDVVLDRFCAAAGVVHPGHV